MTDMVEARCPAKVNLLLRVLARELDGYHGLETLFCRIALHDSIRVSRIAAGIELVVNGADTGPLPENLAWRAADAVLAATGRRFGVSIQLDKRIPVGGGLGGGSSDGAQALLAVNTLAGNAVPGAELLHMAHRLGADVPFFTLDAPLALAWGHGQRLLRLRALPAAPSLLVIPPIPISTRDAYAWVDQARQDTGGRGAIALHGDALANWSDIARMSGNDFESAVFGRVPAIRTAFEALAATRPLLCRMSGSGSTLFGVYRSVRDRDDAVAQLGRKHGSVLATTAGGDALGSAPDS